MSVSAALFCTTTASTKRASDLSNGRRGTPAEHIAALLITPLWPLSPDTVAVLGLNSPREFKECYFVPVASSYNQSESWYLDSGLYLNNGLYLDSPQTVTNQLPDVREGDILVVGGYEYPVHAVAEWVDIAGGIPAMQIIVQQVKGS